MSPSSHIRERQTRTRGTTYQVRYRAGGRDTPWVVVATFGTLREARAAKQWVDGELAAGRRPDLAGRLRSVPKTVAALAAEFAEGLQGASQRKRHRQTVLRLGELGGRVAGEVTGRDVQAWVNQQASPTGARAPLSPASLRQYLGELRRIFAWGEIVPNPAEWAHLRIPRAPEGEPEPDPPGLPEFERLAEAITPRRYRDVLVVLEGTGMRIGELVRLRHGDVDHAGHRIRVASKTAAGLRFVPLVARVAAAIERTAAPEDRLPARAVFPGLSDNGLRNAMGRACKHLGMRHFSPHDLRDRYITCLSLAGVPLPLIRQIAGHTRNTVTLDVYTHVILDEPAGRLAELRRAVGLMTGLAGEAGGVEVGA